MSDFYEILKYYKKKEDTKKQRFEEFKFPSRKKFSHKLETEDLPDSAADTHRYAVREILEPCEKLKNYAVQNDSAYETETSLKGKENAQKSITWRSPLVFSPKVKFSPKINLQNIPIAKQNAEKDAQNECNNTFDTSTSSKNNPTHLTVNNQGTPTHKSRGTRFFLRDEDYNETLTSRQDDYAFDICSSSFLEGMGLTNNQNRSTSRFKKTQPSPTTNYYSQLLSQPIQVQKHKNQDKFQPTDNKNLKTTEDGDKENRDIKYFRQPLPQTEVSEKFDSSQQINPSGENIEQQLQDVKYFERQNPHEVILAGNRPVSYSDVSQSDLNRSFVSSTNTLLPRQTYPIETPTNIYTQQQNPYPYRYVQQRFPDLVHIPDHHQEFIQDNYVSARPRPNEFVCSDHVNYSKPPRSVHLSRNFPDTNFERFPFERKSSNLEAMSLNQSQIFDNDHNIEDFYRQRSYFNNDPSRIDDFVYQPCVERDNRRDPLQNYKDFGDHFQSKHLPQRNLHRMLSQNETMSRENQDNYPGTLSFEDFKQQSGFPTRKFREIPPHTQTSSLMQRESFEDQLNEEYHLKNSKSSFFRPVASESTAQKFTEPYDKLNFAQKTSPQIPYRRDPRTSFDTFSYNNFNQRNKPECFDRTMNENLVKSLNRTLSFEENSHFVDENLNYGHNSRFSGPIYGVERDNPSFPPRDWGMRGQNFEFRGHFEPQRGPCISNRNFTVARRYPECYFSPTTEEMGTFPPSNDKEYVLNKFLFSLNK